MAEIEEVFALIDEFVETQEKTNPNYYITMRRSLSRHIANGLADVSEKKIAALTQRIARLEGALRGVAIMLNTELERYESEPWAQRVRAALKGEE
jgi:hypothetical protein